MNRPSLLAEPQYLDKRVSDFHRTVSVLWSRVSLAAAGTHLVFLLVFAALGLPLLAGVNVVSIAVHLICRRLFVAGRSVPAVVLLSSEVLLHAGIATRILGPDSGFQLYILTLVMPLLITLSGSITRKLLWVVTIGVYYGALDAWTRQTLPMTFIAPHFIDALRYFNLAGMLALMAFVLLTYASLVTDTESMLRAQANTDPLTGLHNRRRVLEIARQVQADRRGRPDGLCVLLCDVDHFKGVNDHHGHEVGDRVLQQVGQVLHATLRDNDVVARWGGEEFLVLVLDADLDTAAAVAERLRSAVARAQVPIPPQPPLALTVTIGAARLRDGETIDAVIARADAALYRGKAEGRDRVITEYAQPRAVV